MLDSVLTFLARRNFHAHSRASLALKSFTDENFGTTRSLTAICSTKFLSSLCVSSSSHAAIFKRAHAIHTFHYPWGKWGTPQPGICSHRKIPSSLRESHSSRAAILTRARLIRSYYYLLGKWGTTRCRNRTRLQKNLSSLHVSPSSRLASFTRAP